MDLKQLEYFVRVAELGSFTRAASVLDIAQPALSRQVRLLEVELRQNLLLRNGRGVTTTDAGRLLLEHGRGILHQVARAREDLGRVRGALAGRVAVGLPPSVGRLMTVPLTREFRQRLPNAALSVSEGLTISMMEGLQTGRLDIALLYNPPASPDLDTRALLTEELFLIGRREAGRRGPAKTVTLEQISRLPLVIPSRPNAIRMLVETAMAGIGCKPRISLEIDGVSAILDLVAEGMGHAILPQYALASVNRPDDYRASAIVKPRLNSHLVLATAAGRTTTMTQQAMLDLIAEIAHQVLAAPLKKIKSGAAPA